MSAAEILRDMRQDGFTLIADGNDIVVNPPGKITNEQRDRLRAHKAEILDALRVSGIIVDEGQHSGRGPDNDHRALIHVPELVLSDGRKISCDMTVPRANLDKLRAVIRFTLKDNGGGGSLLGEQGKSEAELMSVLAEKYGDRLATIDGDEVRS